MCAYACLAVRLTMTHPYLLLLCQSAKPSQPASRLKAGRRHLYSYFSKTHANDKYYRLKNKNIKSTQISWGLVIMMRHTHTPNISIFANHIYNSQICYIFSNRLYTNLHTPNISHLSIEYRELFDAVSRF